MSLTQNETPTSILEIVSDLLVGVRHSRRSVAWKTGKSLATADRWLEQIQSMVPNVRRIREGKTTWLVYDAKSATPSASAAAGMCIAGGLSAMFDGSQQERNLKDARDYVLRARGCRYGDLDRKFVLAVRGSEQALPDKGPFLDGVVEAILENRRLKVQYRHNSGACETLNIAPLSLIAYENRFYVLGESRGEYYPYRFARITTFEATGESFEYPRKGQYNPHGLLSRSFGIHLAEAGPTESVTLRLTEPWASFALTHRWHLSQSATRADDGSVWLTLNIPLCRELETWILGFGECATVIAPTSLRHAVIRRLHNAAANYADGPSLAKTKGRPKAPKERTG